MKYQPIGIIHTPFKHVEGMPIQPAGAAGVSGSIELYPEFVEGLQDLEGFSHIILLYHFHRARKPQLTVVPFMDTVLHGVFATRSPRRPNPIGLSTVKLRGIQGNILAIESVDMLDSTPLLDIKPYVPEFDACETVKVGWLEQARGRVKNQKSDNRQSGDL
jgi:tRNA-Thr(GGU) m(6)t(6)A37 methyltransferase TsaA